MRYLSLITLALLTSGCKSCRDLPPPSGVQIYLLTGQSLMTGHWNTPLVEPADVHVKMFKNGSWSTAAEPITADNTATYGPGVAFGKEMRRLNPSIEIGLVSCAVGSTTIDEWMPNSCDNPNLPVCGLYEACQAMLQQAMDQAPGSQFAGILVNQGQSDLHEGGGYWDSAFARLTDFWHSSYGASLPIVFAQIGVFIDPLRSQAEVDDFKRRQANIRKDNVYMIVTDDLTTVDGVHLTTEGQIKQGQRFAQIVFSVRPSRECTEKWYSRFIH